MTDECIACGASTENRVTVALTVTGDRVVNGETWRRVEKWNGSIHLSCLLPTAPSLPDIVAAGRGRLILDDPKG